jgi:hypothetical protein
VTVIEYGEHTLFYARTGLYIKSRPLGFTLSLNNDKTVTREKYGHPFEHPPLLVTLTNGALLQVTALANESTAESLYVPPIQVATSSDARTIQSVPLLSSESIADTSASKAAPAEKMVFGESIPLSNKPSVVAEVPAAAKGSLAGLAWLHTYVICSFV